MKKLIKTLEEKHIISYCALFNLFLVFLFFVIKDSQKELIDVLNVVIIILTFIAIVIYTQETKKLRELTEKQLHVAFLPIVNLISIGNEIIIKNSGKCPALNVRIKEVSNGLYKGGKYSFSFGDPIPLLNVDEEKKILIKVIPPPTGSQNPNSDPFLNPKNSTFTGTYDLTIYYEDIGKKAISTVFEINKKGINFKKII